MGTGKVKKILYISGTRADYGLMRQALLEIRKKHHLEIAVCGMHLMPQFGQTLAEIEKDGFKTHRIEAVYSQDNKDSMIEFIGQFVMNLLIKLKKIKPDIILVQGDRAEMIAGALTGAYLGLPVAHTHGGDVSSTVDEMARHAITKLSHIHFPASKESAKRIIKMGEDKWRVFMVGAPGLDSINDLYPQKEILSKYNLSLPFILVLQHPVTIEEKDAEKQMKETMEAVKELKVQTIVIYPNADPGARRMIKAIEQYRKYPFIQIYKNIEHKDFLSLMKSASVLIGNSSSGIVEAPSLRLPVVNVGTRQKDREKAGNTIDVAYSKEEIKKAVLKVLKMKKRKYKDVYGNGNAGKKISEILAKIEINKKLLDKKIAY